MQGTRISFRSKEDAIHFAEKQGISYQDHYKRYTVLIKISRMGLFCVRCFFGVEHVLTSNSGNLR